MNKRYSRKEFLRLSAAALSGALLANRGFAVTAEPGSELLDAPPQQGYAVPLLSKGDSRYNELRQGFNKRYNLFPAAIALCSSTAEVAEAVRYARDYRFPVAIKSGGHSFEGFSCNNGGLVVNLSKLRSVEWIDKTTIRVGPACTLSELYNAILPKGRIIPAGSCGGVGVGGLTLGGGYGFFSRKYGLTCDSLIEATMVDGAGKVRSTKDDKELLWACRGGNNGNLGVVTELVFTTHAAPASFRSHRFKARHLTAASAKQILEHWFSLTASLPESCFSAFVLNGSTLNILLTDFEDHTTELKPVLDGLAAHTTKSSIGKPIHLASALKNYYGRKQPMYFKNASAGLYSGYNEISSFIEEVLDIVVTTPGMIYQVNTLGGAIANTKFEAGSCFPYRSKNYLSELQTYWEESAREQRLTERFELVQQLFTSKGITAQYANYPDLGWRNAQQLYYGNNLARLQALKKTYDPDNRFTHAQSIKV